MAAPNKRDKEFTDVVTEAGPPEEGRSESFHGIVTAVGVTTASGSAVVEIRIKDTDNPNLDYWYTLRNPEDERGEKYILAVALAAMTSGFRVNARADHEGPNGKLYVLRTGPALP